MAKRFFFILVLCLTLICPLAFTNTLVNGFDNGFDNDFDNHSISVSEIFYNPLGSDYCCEFLEFYANQPLNISGYIVGDASSNDSLQLIKWSNSNIALIIPQNFSYVNISNLNCNVYSVDSRIGNGLNNNGDQIYLYNSNNSMVLNFSYSNTAPEGYSLQSMIDNDLWVSILPTPCELINYTQFFDVSIFSNMSVINISTNLTDVLTANNSANKSTIIINVSLFTLTASSITDFSQASVETSVYYNGSLRIRINYSSNNTNHSCPDSCFNTSQIFQTFQNTSNITINTSSKNYSKTFQPVFFINMTNISLNNSSSRIGILDINILLNACAFITINNYNEDNNSLNNYGCGWFNISFSINLSSIINDTNNQSDSSNNSNSSYLNQLCSNTSLKLLLNKNLLVLGESLKFKPVIYFNIADETNNETNETNVTIQDCNFTTQYWVEDLKGVIVKSKRNTSNQDWKSFTASESTVNGFEKAFLVRAELIFGNQIIANNYSLIVFYNQGYDEEQQQEEYQAIESNISIDATLDDESITINLNAYKGDTNKEVLNLKTFYDKNVLLSLKNYLNKKFSSINQVIEIPIKTMGDISCARSFNITVEGLGFKSTKRLNNSYYYKNCKQANIKSLKIIPVLKGLHNKDSFGLLVTIAYEYINLEEPVLELKLYKILKTNRLVDNRIMDLKNETYMGYVISGSKKVIFNISRGVYKVKAVLSDGKELSALEEVINTSINSSNISMQMLGVTTRPESNKQNKDITRDISKNKKSGFVTGFTIFDIAGKNKRLFFVILTILVVTLIGAVIIKTLKAKNFLNIRIKNNRR